MNHSHLKGLYKLSLYSTATQTFAKFRIGGSVQSKPPTRNFALGIPTCWYLKTLKFVLPPTGNIKFALPPNANPNAGQWNIGSPTQNLHVGHVHFMLFVLISFALVTQREPSLQWNMGFRQKQENGCVRYHHMEKNQDRTVDNFFYFQHFLFSLKSIKVLLKIVL